MPVNPLSLLRQEFVQRRDEGAVIPPWLDQRLAELHPDKDLFNAAAVEPLYEALLRVPGDPQLAAAEPDELAAIRALRPAGPRNLHWAPDEATLYDRIYGAWLTRCVGCAMGKPVEGCGMTPLPGGAGMQHGRTIIKGYLQRRNAYPLADYMSQRDVPEGWAMPQGGSYQETINGMEDDDDIRYTVLGLMTVEAKGPGFQWSDLARAWTNLLPLGQVCSAEDCAIFNFLARGEAATPAYTRSWRNPFREWIGAQIRIDAFAWVTAGNPERAAELAWRDASWTHTRNGVYGAMFWAALQSAAFVEHDVRRLIGIGLSEIPRDCRLARAIHQQLAWLDQEPALSWEGMMDRIDAATPGMHPVHAINNTLHCTAALLHGGIDPIRVPALAVMGGMDTDCNGATVGSVAGAATGFAAMDRRLSDRLKDEARLNMVGISSLSLSDLARRTCVQWQRLQGG
jgi:ADP-ribosylglycohydrolase